MLTHKLMKILNSRFEISYPHLVCDSNWYDKDMDHTPGVKKKPEWNGFTLIELLVVISIIGVLAALVVVNYSSARVRTRDVTRKSDFAQIKRALRLYYNDNHTYPDAITFDAAWLVGDMTYMRLIPDDPLEGVSYQYFAGSVVCSDGINDFRLVAVLENKSDGEIAQSHSRCPNDCGFTWNEDDADEYVVCAD